MEIAGTKCNVCGKPIILAKEGKYCSRCATSVHIDCEPRSECPVCRQPYTVYASLKADPLENAFIPRALRPGMSGAGFLLLIVGLAFVAYVLYYLLEDAVAHGH